MTAVSIAWAHHARTWAAPLLLVAIAAVLVILRARGSRRLRDLADQLAEALNL